jgi:hypothetical protein
LNSSSIVPIKTEPKSKSSILNYASRTLCHASFLFDYLGESSDGLLKSLPIKAKIFILIQTDTILFCHTSSFFPKDFRFDCGECLFIAEFR